MSSKKKPDQKYRGNGNHEWEPAALNTYRLRVPGGWLYRYEVPGTNIYSPGPVMAGCQEFGAGGPVNSPSYGYGVSVKTDGLLALQLVPMPEVVKHKV